MLLDVYLGSVPVYVYKSHGPCLRKTGTTRKRHTPNSSTYPGITLGRALYLTALYDLATSNGHHGDVRKKFTDRLNLDGRACGLQNPPRHWINPGLLIILRKDALPTSALLP